MRFLDETSTNLKPRDFSFANFGNCSSGVPVLMAFMEGEESFISETLSDEQLLQIGM